MDHRYIAEHNVAARYVMSTLSGEERVEFEEHFVDCPQCLAEIEAEGHFRQGLKVAAARDARPPAKVTSWLLPLAAMILVLLGATLMVIQTRQQLSQTRLAAAARERQYTEALRLAEARDRKPDETPSASVPIFPLIATRGESASEPATRLPLSPKSEWIVLTLDRAGLADFPSYRATITDATGRRVVEPVSLQEASGEALGLGLRANLLPEGSYVLSVEGLSRDGRWLAAGRFRFRVVPPR